MGRRIPDVPQGVWPKWVTPQRPGLNVFTDTAVPIPLLETHALRDLAWYSRQNLGPMPDAAWRRYCEEARAPLSPERHGRESLVAFLTLHIWPDGNPDDTPELRASDQDWDWDEAKQPRALGQVLQRVLSDKGAVRGGKYGLRVMEDWL